MNLVMFPDFINVRWITLHGVVTTVTVIVYILTSHLLKQRRHPAAAIAWMLFILLLPYLALPLFLSFGARKLRQVAGLTPRIVTAKLPHNAWAIATIDALGLEPEANYSHLNIHADGQNAKQALFEIIGKAQVSIELCTYLLSRDRFGAEVIELLCTKASSGIKVRILLDGFSQIIWLRSDLRKLRASGAMCITFAPPISALLKGRSNLRNHRKLVIADAGMAQARMWCGGRNLGAEYFEGDGRKAAWHDLSFDLQGPLILQAIALFEQDWHFARHLKLMGTSAKMHPEIHSGRQSPQQSPRQSQPVAQLVPSGPDRVDDTLHALLLTAAYQARDHIAIITPYFVPDAALLMALCMAARRGVQVELLMPIHSNHRLSDFARNRSIRALFLAGGRIWFCQAMQHAKLIVVDEVLALSGSANMDNRSLFLNYELMIAFHSRPDILLFQSWFDTEKRTAKLFSPQQPTLVRDLAEGMILWLGFQL
jgi:cardiolipin synthase A/B